MLINVGRHVVDVDLPAPAARMLAGAGFALEAVVEIRKDHDQNSYVVPGSTTWTGILYFVSVSFLYS